jgi:hypothetical protein
MKVALLELLATNRLVSPQRHDIGNFISHFKIVTLQYDFLVLFQFS